MEPMRCIGLGELERDNAGFIRSVCSEPQATKELPLLAFPRDAMQLCGELEAGDCSKGARPGTSVLVELRFPASRR